VREIHVYTQRERDLGLVDVFDFFVALSLSLSRLFTLVCIYVCKYGYDATYKNKKKRIEHTHNLETVVERGSVHIETNKHIPYVFISCQTTNKKLQKKK
jgi:hypothetical protein